MMSSFGALYAYQPRWLAPAAYRQARATSGIDPPRHMAAAPGRYSRSSVRRSSLTDIAYSSVDPAPEGMRHLVGW
jgi:hypothetical protein